MASEANGGGEDSAMLPATGGTNTRFAHSADVVAEWRSREQLEPSVASTSPGYWDSEDDDSSALSSLPGPKPAELYGKFTWKIENFSEISKRELRSNVFEVGGYKWYILVYPQGCDVCNHLSLFLCVADYDKLLPGWSHFAQFTIAVVNKDPKKSKYSDTLHRFCKKEHDWGWKKFMELSKVLDGFTNGDTLVIKAQVQVIRENPHRPFRCLDCQYRRELVRVYLTNVEGICRRFVEEKREKLGKVIEDTLRWSSFRAFWSAVEENARRRLAREKTDVIFKAVVKRFFNEKEVTSTLVMDALYSGCKALEYQKNKKHKAEAGEDSFAPVVWMEKEFFVLAGDILALLERAVLEPLPSYKDDKGPQNRSKDGVSGEDFGKEFVERDERRLTELGRRTVEMFVLAHLFSNRIEVAYREAVALKRQEELIREEEAAGQAESELKAKREAAEREKRTKKKQAKQRRKDRKVKDKDAAEKRLEQEQLQDLTANARLARSILLAETGDEEGDSGLDSVAGTLGTSEDLVRGSWDSSSFVQEASFSGSLNEETGVQAKRAPGALDDSSSTCSSDSLPSVRPTSSRAAVSEQSYFRGRNRAAVDGFDSDGRLIEGDAILRTVVDARSTGETSSSCSAGAVDTEAVILSLKDRVRWLEKRLHEKEEENVLLHEQLSFYQHKETRNLKSRPGEIADCRLSSEAGNNLSNGRSEGTAQGDGDSVQKGRTSTVRQLKTCKASAANGYHHSTWSTEHVANGTATRGRGSDSSNVTKVNAYKADNEITAESKPGMTASAMPVVSRPMTAANGARPFPVQTVPPTLARSVSSAGRLNNTECESPLKQTLPVSYRNAAVGRLHNAVSDVQSGVMANGTYTRSPAPTSNATQPATPKLPPSPKPSKADEALSSAPDSADKRPQKGGANSQSAGDDSISITFGTITQEVLHSEHQHQSGEDSGRSEESTVTEIQSSPTKDSSSSRPSTAKQQRLSPAAGSFTILTEDFPHLDIINDLLDDDKTLLNILHPGYQQKQLHQQQQQQQQRRLVIPSSERDGPPQMMSSYGHPPLGLQSEAGNGVHRYWPISRSMSASYSSDAQARYPLVQGHHHVLVPHDGYSVYTPLQ